MTYRVKKIKKKMGAKTKSTFDFSTLYTKIPHEKLNYVLAEVVKFAYTQVVRGVSSLLMKGLLVGRIQMVITTASHHPSHMKPFLMLLIIYLIILISKLETKSFVK